MRNATATSLGSGFVIHAAGYIITNEHVIDEATDVKVTFSDGQELPAEVIATDNEHDLAVLKVSSKKALPAIALGTSEDLMIGEPVYAIGNPFGYAGTMTRGIVSAVNRKLDIDEKKSYTGLIQTDASINPGNSGGPLINAYGQVVGINTAIRAGATGIGFAIAVSNMRDLLPTFLNPEATNKAQIGFTVEEKRKTSLPATVRSEVVVKTVKPDGGAAKAGMMAGDRIVKIGDVAVGNVVDALVALAGAKPADAGRPDDTLNIEVMRGTGRDAQADSGEAGGDEVAATAAESVVAGEVGSGGGDGYAAAVVKKYGLVPGLPGVFLTAVKKDGPAGTIGLQPGDMIYQLGRYRLTEGVETLEALLKSVTDDVDAPIRVVRGNQSLNGVIHIAG